MAFISVKLKSEKVSLSSGVWSGTRVYDVESNDIDDDVLGAVNADDGTESIPDIGDAWKVGSVLKARGYDVSHVENDDSYYYSVTVNYSSKDDSDQVTIENPLARPTIYSYEDSLIQEPYFRDETTPNALPAVNSAGDDFTDLPLRDRSEGVIVITRNVASFSDTAAEIYRNTVNSSSVSINGISYSAGTLRIIGWSANGPNEENGVTFDTETIRIAKRSAGWDDIYEDRGLHKLDSGKRVPILDGNNLAITVPYPLDGSGGAKTNPTDTPATITLKPYKTTSYPSF